MSDHEVPQDLQEVEARLHALSRRVVLDPYHKRRTREELMRRHREMSAVRSQRAADMLLSRLTGTRRLTLVAPPALAVVLAIALVLTGIPFSHSNQTQTAEAAHIQRILPRAVAHTTSWKWTLHRWTVSGGASVERLGYSTTAQRLRIANHHATLYFNTGNHWYRVPATYGRNNTSLYLSSGYWQWQVETLAQRLAGGHFTLKAGQTIRGIQTEGVQYQLGNDIQEQAQATAWVARKSGLVLRLDLVVTRGGQVVERDTADYSYGQS